MSKYLHKSPLSHICTNHSLLYIHSVYIWLCASNSGLAITWFGAMSPGRNMSADTMFKTIVGYTNLVFFLSRTEKPAKVGTCVLDRRALQQLALNVHVKHSDLYTVQQVGNKHWMFDSPLAHFPSLLWMCMSNTLTWPDQPWHEATPVQTW